MPYKQEHDSMTGRTGAIEHDVNIRTFNMMLTCRQECGNNMASLLLTVTRIVMRLLHGLCLESSRVILVGIPQVKTVPRLPNEMAQGPGSKMITEHCSRLFQVAMCSFLSPS